MIRESIILLRQFVVFLSSLIPQKILNENFHSLLLLLFVAQSCLTLGTPRTVAYQAPSSVGFPRQKSSKQIAIFPSRGSSQPTDQNHISCMGRQILYC